MKRILLLWVSVLCLSIPLMFMSGCTKKEEPKTETQTEQMEETPTEEAPVDTTASDTAQAQQPE